MTRPDQMFRMSDTEVYEGCLEAARKERESTLRLLQFLREIERRQIDLKRGYGDAFDFCVKALKMSRGAAGRRIQAMRLLQDVPEVATRLESGQISLTAASQLQGFIQRERKLKKTYSAEDKSRLVEQIQDKSEAECARLFFSISPESALPAEKTRVISDELTEVRFHAGQELMRDLEKIRDLLAHQFPNATFQELIGYMAQLTLKKLDPSAKPSVKKSNQEAKPVIPALRDTPPPKTYFKSSPVPDHVSQQKAYVPATLQRFVRSRDQHRCSFKDPETGQRCGSRYALELDHVTPRVLGGLTTAENLRLLCRNHNLYEATRILGRNMMKPYLRRLS